MNCPKCGDVCSCVMDPPSSAVSAESLIPPAAPPQSASSEDTQSGNPASAWRDELSSRLNRYRTRRKAPPPRYPSLRLPFDRVEPTVKTYTPSEEPRAAVFEPISAHALALDGMQQIPPPPQTIYQAPAPAEEVERPFVAQSAAPSSAKIIEFPRFAWAPPSPPPDQLAEPVMAKPRILEVPEVAPPPPALGGISIEAVEVEEPAKRPGIDMPVRCAPLGWRVLASLTDGLIVCLSAALFGFIFWKIAAVRPPRLQMLGIAAGILFAFWTAYQYLLVVYSARTPGLLLARLQIAQFDGKPARRSLRRWRILASFLSTVSLGMGYIWVFLDEDSLCWHDRITRTYLAPREFTVNNKR